MAVQRVEDSLQNLTQSDAAPITSATLEHAQSELQQLLVLVDQANDSERLSKEMGANLNEAVQKLQYRLDGLSKHASGTPEHEKSLQAVRDGIANLKRAVEESK